jgi:hypothetical protein
MSQAKLKPRSYAGFRMDSQIRAPIVPSITTKNAFHLVLFPPFW